MPDLIPWEYDGHTFHVAASLTEAAKDSACARLLSEWERRKPDKSQTVSKALELKSDPVVPVSNENALGDDWEALAVVLFDSGHYRKPCRVCGEGIVRSGKRGRAPTIHVGCRA